MSAKNVLVTVIKKLAKSGGELCAAAVGVQSAESGCCGTSAASSCCGAVHPADDLPSAATRPSDPPRP